MLPNLPNKKYQIIYADPPWSFSSRLRSSKMVEGKYQSYKPDTTVGEGRYATMKTEDIAAIPVNDIANEDCILFLWTTDAHIPDALNVISSWGFTYKTVGFVWNKKEKSGKQVCYFGSWTMKGTELCLLGTKGRIHSKIKRRNVRQLVEAPRDRTIHSSKPPEVRDRIVELMGNLSRIELFAREHVPGWDAWGLEV